MESSIATLLPFPPSKMLKAENEVHIFGFEALNKEGKLPREFIWPSKDLVAASKEEFEVPLIDLGAIKGDEVAMADAIELVRNACMKHGFFEVTNHGVDPNLINDAYKEIDSIFKLPMSKKLSARANGRGYSFAHAERFSSSLPWKEIFTFQYKHINESESQVVDFFKSIFGEDFQHTGLVYYKYCEAMKELCVVLLDLLAISLGVDRLHYQRLYEDAESIMRCNFYPPCRDSLMTLGTGPHCDPTSITILLQDEVEGLEIFVDNKWLPVHPRPGTFVINIGDTFSALTNGIYKSCLHRAIANKEKERKNMAFFVCPKADKTLRPPENLLVKEEEKNYPEFTWKQLFEFTQKHHRADADTLPAFISWLHSSNPCNI